MDQVSAGRVKGLRIAIAAFVLSIFLFLLVAGGGIYLVTAQSTKAEDFSSELRDGLVASCESNGNPLREAVQKMLRDDIAQSRSPVLRRLFPQVPRAELDALIRADNEADRATIESIAPVDCASLYPRP
jgi:uncharacterized membrane protein